MRLATNILAVIAAFIFGMIVGTEDTRRFAARAGCGHYEFWADRWIFVWTPPEVQPPPIVGR